MFFGWLFSQSGRSHPHHLPALVPLVHSHEKLQFFWGHDFICIKNKIKPHEEVNPLKNVSR